MSAGKVTVHDYNRSRHSGAGNCECGRPEVSVLHPHEFTPWSGDPFKCCCMKPPNFHLHREVSP